MSRTDRLPMTTLVTALQAYQRHPTAPARRSVSRALDILASTLQLNGLRLTIDTPVLVPLEVGSGSLARVAGGTEREELRAPTDGAMLGTLGIAAAPTVKDTGRAVRAVELAVDAVRGQERAARAEANLAALDAAVRGIAGVLTVDRVLQLIVDRVRELAGAQYAALGIVNDDGAITAFFTSGIGAAARRRIGALPRGHGLLGLIIRQNAAFRIADIATDARRYGFPPHHPPMHTFLGVPVTVGGRSVGNLYLTNKRGRREFSEEDQQLVERFARHAGIAIDNARLHEQVQRLVVVEERERIGRDLHDGIIQRIYGVNLSLDDVPDLVASDPDEAARRVDHAVDALNATIAEIREFIYALRPPAGGASALSAALEALVAEVRLQTAVAIQLDAADPPPIASDVVAELLSIVREALSNVVRHAAATRAKVRLRQRGRQLRLEIVDDGRGFDPDAPAHRAHHGLVNMRQRAERHGGALEVASRRDAGTRIIVTLPLDAGRRPGGRKRDA